MAFRQLYLLAVGLLAFQFGMTGGVFRALLVSPRADATVNSDDLLPEKPVEDTSDTSFDEAICHASLDAAGIENGKGHWYPLHPSLLYALHGSNELLRPPRV